MEIWLSNVADKFNILDIFNLPAKSVGLASFADQVDGSILTWNAAGVAALIGPGAATDFVGGNGAGAAASFKVPAGGGGGLANEGVQARRTTTLALTTAFADITLDATDVETDAAIVEHDNALTDRLNLIAAGLYWVWSRVDIDVPAQTSATAEVQTRVRVNDAGTGIDGSEGHTSAFDDGSIPGDTVTNSIECGFLYEATAGDFITLQALKVNVGNIPIIDTRAGGVVFGAVRLTS